MKCQFDAFADYVSEAEGKGIENFPLYDWTKRTIEDPVKKAKYTKSFALYVAGNFAGARRECSNFAREALWAGGDRQPSPWALSCFHDHFEATVDHAFSVKGHRIRVRL